MAGSSTAFGLPWDVDMADGQAQKAYSIPMAVLPEGVIPQEHIFSPKAHMPNMSRMDPEANGLMAPFPASPDAIEQGRKMFGVYCTPCHGDGQVLGPVAAPGRFPGVVPLSGDTGVAKLRTDGWIYLTIRNGGALMPSYGWAMDDTEMWSIVHYVRTLPNARQTPPAPPSE
jgi:mono/diheme cytochrome c family protein